MGRLAVSNDTKWIIGTSVGVGLAVVTAVLTVAGLLLAQLGAVNARIDDLRTELGGFRTDANARIDDLRTELRDFRTDVVARMEGFDARLREVEVALGRVDQRLLVIERVVLPTPEPPAE